MSVEQQRLDPAIKGISARDGHTLHRSAVSLHYVSYRLLLCHGMPVEMSHLTLTLGLRLLGTRSSKVESPHPTYRISQ